MSLHTVALVRKVNNVVTAYVDMLPGKPTDYSLLLFNNLNEAAEVLSMVRESEPNYQDLGVMELPVAECFKAIQSIRQLTGPQEKKVKYVAFLTLTHRLRKKTEIMADFFPINDVVKGGSAGFVKILRDVEKRTQKRIKHNKKRRGEDPEQVGERLSGMMNDIPKFAEHITADKLIQSPKNVTDPPTTVELKYIEKMLNTFKVKGGDVHRLNPRGTKIVFQLYLNDKEFEMVGLPAGPGKINAGEFWGIRIMVCLRHLGWKARNLMLDDRDFGRRNPEMN